MKKIKSLIKKLISYFFFPVILFILFLKKIFNIDFDSIDSTRIGNLAIVPEILARKKKKKNICLLFFYQPIANDYIFKLYKRELQKHKIYCIKINFLINFINKLAFVIFGKYLFFSNKINYPDLDIFNKSQFLKFSKSDIKKGYQYLKKLKIKNKWICIHVRDNKYFSKFKKNFNYHDYRNFSIQTMNKLINFFLKKNFTVIRIGKSPKEKILIKNKNLIDLPFSKHYSDFLEVFLIANSQFFIGTSSGIYKVARIFRRPVFLINVSPFESLFRENWDFPMTFKRPYDLKKKVFLKISEIIDKKISHFFNIKMLKKINIEYKSNTSIELVRFAEDILLYLKNKKLFLNDHIYKKKISLFRKEITKDLIIKKMNYKNNISRSFLKSTKL